MGAEFIVEKGALKGLIFALEKGEEWIMGRDPAQCDIVIEDAKVARKQLICRKIPEGYLIENLSQADPVLVNDRPITQPTLLKNEDRVTVGETVFRFYLERVVEGYGFGVEPHTPREETPPPSEEEEIVPREEIPLPPEEEEVAPQEEMPLSPEEEEVAPQEEMPPPPEEEVAPEEEGRETIFEEIEMAELPEVTIDLTPAIRFLIKVIAGPNTGAEFALELDRDYLIGTDTVRCDVVFNDLSVSREHARIVVSREGSITIEDLKSRNGVIVDGERIADKKTLSANAVIGLGTSAFFLIDREAPAETIVAPVFEVPSEEEKEEVREEEVVVAKAPEEKKPAKPFISTGALILALIVGGFAVLLGIGMVSLFQEKAIEKPKIDYLAEIQAAIKNFPSVNFTYNEASKKLFLIGHVRTGIERSELLYKLQGLTFIKAVEDNIVNDEAVWQEMNILISKNPNFKGVSLHSPEPGIFVLNGYLENEKQAADLTDYMNVHFNYLSLLNNLVVVEQRVVEEVTSRLLQHFYGAITVGFSNGELQLTGYISSTQTDEYEKLVSDFSQIHGVRSVKNFVVSVSPEKGVIDLNRRYPGRYLVTGYSRHGDMNVNVVINGKILTRGDRLDDMTITSIQPNTIFLEKNLLKYKIEYNK